MKGEVFTLEAKYGKVEKYNSHFHKVKVYVAYAGKNRNGTIISRETFENMIPSIYGIPIIGEYRDEKFNGHGGELVINDDGAEFYDTTKAFGYIDSSAEVRWENVEDDDGVTREYLTIDGFLWTGKYPEAIEALDGKHNQSMELTINEGDFTEDDDGEYFEITDAEFLALCILSPEVEPCFEGAGISQFNLDLDQKKFRAEFTEMVASLKKSFSSNKELKANIEGGDNLKNDKDILKNEEDVDVDVDVDVEVEVEESAVTLEDATTAVEKAEESKMQVDIDDARGMVNDLESDDDKQPLLDRLNAIEVEDAEEPEEDMEEEDDAYEEKSDEEEIEEEESTEDYEKKFAELEVKFNELTTEHEALSLEVVGLREFKAAREQELNELKEEEIRQEKVDYINENYSDIDNNVKELFVDKVDEYATVEDIDSDICVYIVKNKVTFSKASKKSVTKMEVELDKKTKAMSPYGDLF